MVMFAHHKIKLLHIIIVLHVQETGGYGSVFGDGKEINVDICQHCMNKILIDNQVEI